MNDEKIRRQTRPTRSKAHQPRASTAWLVTVWSMGLFVASAAAGAVCTAVVLLVLIPLFPELRWRLSPLWCLYLTFVPVWAGGVLLACWRHRSWNVAAYIALVGIFLATVGPLLVFVSILVMFGGYSGP